MVDIPRKKSDVLRDYHSRRGQELPALNVKDHGRVEYTAERIAAHYGCDERLARRAVEFVYESEHEQFWDYDAPELLNHVMLGPDKGGDYAPVGLKESPFKVYAEGRSGGWLVVEGLPPVSEWDGATFQKWRKFARLIRETMEFKRTFECARDLIDANEWCPKAGTTAGNREAARMTPSARLAQAALAIHGELDGQEWDGADCLDRIAGHLRAAGLAVAEAGA